MFVNKKVGEDDILLKSNTTGEAQVIVEDKDTTGLVYSWEILPEDWYQVNNIYGSKRLKPINGLLVKQNGNHVIFKTPVKEGPYRIYVNIYDKYHNVSTSNVPFFVVSSN
jgi:hypothetical protein